MTRTFYAVLGNSLAASLANTFVWFAVTFWVYLQTGSVVATSVMAGVYTGTVALSGVFLGTLVDRYPKKPVMLGSSLTSLLLYALAWGVLVSAPPEAFTEAGSPTLWLFVLVTLFGALVGNLRGIALLTLVTLLVPEGVRDRANGLVGTVNGVAFLAASVLSGVVIGFLGMGWTLALALGLTLLAALHLGGLGLPEAQGARGEPAEQQTLDLRGTLRAVRSVPGLLALIFFGTFNNFLGGIFMALMVPYGLSLVSVQVWGALWGFLSLGFIVGGLMVAKRGLGENPLKTLFLVNLVMWTVCVFFTLQASVVLLTVGLFVWLCLVPVAEAAEQTIFQRVIPPTRQGRVFGFAQSLEQAASPVMAFVIGPVAQLVFIPFMTTGQGVRLLGGWFGTGPDRGMALLFSVAGLFGLTVTLLAMRSHAYRTLSDTYRREDRAREPQPSVGLEIP